MGPIALPKRRFRGALDGPMYLPGRRAVERPPGRVVLGEIQGGSMAVGETSWPAQAPDGAWGTSTKVGAALGNEMDT